MVNLGACGEVPTMGATVEASRKGLVGIVGFLLKQVATPGDGVGATVGIERSYVPGDQ